MRSLSKDKDKKSKYFLCFWRPKSSWKYLLLVLLLLQTVDQLFFGNFHYWWAEGKVVEREGGEPCCDFSYRKYCSRDKKLPTKFESPDLVVMGEDWCSRGREFESQHRILDEHFHINLVLNFYYLWYVSRQIFCYQTEKLYFQ